MKKNPRKTIRSFPVFSNRTRPRFRTIRGFAFAKWLLLLLSAVIFILVLVPFTITRVFTPEASPEKADQKAKQKIVSEKVKEVPIPDSISVFRDASNKTETVAFEEYVKGVVASEMPSTFEKEALKAQAVAARTYSLAKYQNAKKNGNSSAHPDAPVCDTVHCQVFQDKASLKKIKGSKWMDSDWKKISAAVEETKGELMYYDGELVQQALFHSSSGGKTENCEDVFASAVPYLVSVDSPYEDEATHKKETLTLPVSEFAEKIKAACPSSSFGTITASNIRVQSHSSGGRVEKMKVGNSSVTGVQVRQALGLYSANFEISISDNTITFTTTGSGHGVGMSQYGANGMAEKGYDYQEILKHYYSGISIVSSD